MSTDPGVAEPAAMASVRPADECPEHAEAAHLPPAMLDRSRDTASTAAVLLGGALGSLLIAPYLHASDACLLAVAGWMVWEQFPTTTWRIPLAAAWVLASPFLYVIGLSLPLYRWPLLEIVLLVALVVLGWRPLTSRADARTQAPA